MISDCYHPCYPFSAVEFSSEDEMRFYIHNVCGHAFTHIGVGSLIPKVRILHEVIEEIASQEMAFTSRHKR